jgi:hypothetical protein
MQESRARTTAPPHTIDCISFPLLYGRQSPQNLQPVSLFPPFGRDWSSFFSPYSYTPGKRIIDKRNRLVCTAVYIPSIACRREQLMRGKSQTCNVKDGRIRVTCPRCAKKKYVMIVSGIRKKMVRCVCGMSTLCTLNHRGYPRESTCSKALIILENGRECPVYLCDTSLAGIGFLIPYQHLNSLSNHQEINIKFRSMAGSMIQRKICIKSITNNRIGAQFLGNNLPSF